uniref:MipA/OmpV family protein n=1 Tax=Cellvibrio fontiphilus TaxID=1815559 RepID=UPI002B4BD214|nr:MipA/OmpV family protein [Cellvibrio fontiphilus]
MNLISRLLLRFLFLPLALLLTATALACEQGQGDCVEVGKWDISLGLGAGVRTNPLDDGDDIPLVILPQVNYNGERFFIQNLDFGAILWQSESQQLSLLATPSYDQVFFHRWSPSNFFIDGSTLATAGKESGGKNPVVTDDEAHDRELLTPEFMPLQQRKLRDRKMAGLAGIEYSWSTALADLQIQYLTDFTQIHSGEEVRIAIAKHWQSGKHQWSASLGANWQSRAVVNYYYGVALAEADERGSYQTGSAITPLLRLDWNYELTERWDLRLLASYRELPDEISASPLINDNKVITVFVGGVYHF